MMDRPGVDGLAAQECFDEADPEGGSDGDGVVVEIVAGVVQQAGAIAVAVGTVGSVAVAQEEVAAWALEQHEGEVFGGHDGIDGGDDVVGADDVGEDLCDEGGLFGIVDGGRVVAQEAEFDFGAKAAADAFGEGFHPGFDEVDHFDGEGPDGTAQCGVVGDDVDGVTGDAVNIVPDHATLRGTVRTFSIEMIDLIETRMKALAESICSGFGAKVEFRFLRNYPPTINNPEQTAFVTQVLTDVIGPDNIVSPIDPVMAAEDFSFMLLQRPGCYFFLGNGDGTHRADGHGDGPCLLHNPSYDFNDDAIPVGATLWVRLVEAFLRR